MYFQPIPIMLQMETSIPGPYEKSEMILSIKSLSRVVKFPKQDFTKRQDNICKTIDMNQAYDARIHRGASFRLLTWNNFQIEGKFLIGGRSERFITIGSQRHLISINLKTVLK